MNLSSQNPARSILCIYVNILCFTCFWKDLFYLFKKQSEKGKKEEKSVSTDSITKWPLSLGLGQAEDNC